VVALSGRHSLIADLKRLVGPDSVRSSPEDLVCYSYDGTFEKGRPAAVVLPTTPEQVVDLVRAARKNGFALYPRGAGSGLSGGSVPSDDGVAVSMTRMNHLVEVDEENWTITVEPGVITGRIHVEAEKRGLFYPPDPASSDFCTIGGNVAECAGGPRGLKYGVTKHYVRGLEVVAGTGELLRCGGKTVKNVTGYDLVSLFTGSEGTLGIITRAILRLVPKPKATRTLLASFDRVERAGECVSAVMRSGVVPSTLEIMDRYAVRAVLDLGGTPGDPAGEALRSGALVDLLDPLRRADAVLLIETDGPDAQASEEAKLLVRVCEETGATGVVLAANEEQRQALWRVRKSVSPAVAKIKPAKIGEDATVPRSKVPEMIRRLGEIRERRRVDLVIYGHAGDGNLHPNIAADPRDADEMERAHLAVDDMFEAALELGGTLSGEHGVGTMKAPYLEKEFGPEGVKALRSIKSALDPDGVLNPGKIFPGCGA